MADTVREDVNTTATLSIGQAVSGTIEQNDLSGDTTDHDWYKVSLTAGHTYHCSASGTSGTLDAVAADVKHASDGALWEVFDKNPFFDCTPNRTRTCIWSAGVGSTGVLQVKSGDSTNS